MSYKLRSVALLVSIGILVSQVPGAFSCYRFNIMGLVKMSNSSLSDYAKVTNAGLFPTVTLNRDNVTASLSNVAGLIPGRRDHSNLLFSHSPVVNDAPPIEIFKRPSANSNEHAYTAKYACRLGSACTLTIILTNSENKASNDAEPQTLWGYHLSGTKEYFIMNPNSRKLSE